MSYKIVDVVSDTPEWEKERRKSIGASEMAAVLGLSPFNTPLDVYKSKGGVDKHFDPVLSFIGHESEHIIHKWVEQFSGVDVKLEPAFMARSKEYPFIHASFDRVSSDPFTTWQMKTAHHYSGHQWSEGIPTDIRVQVQTEMLVAGTRRAAVVVWIGGREFKLFWEQRDDMFIQEHLIPAAQSFWDRVQSGEAPAPSTPGEVSDLWHDSGEEMEAPEELQERIEQREFLLASAKEAKADADKIQLSIGQFMLDHNVEAFTINGRKRLTYKRQKGRTSFDKERLEEEHPKIVAEYTTQGAPFMVMRTHKPKEKK